MESNNKMESNTNTQAPLGCRLRRRRVAAGLNNGDHAVSIIAKSTALRCRSFHGYTSQNVARPLLFLMACCSVFSVTLGWSPSSSSLQSQLLPMQSLSLRLLNSRPTTRLEVSSAQLWASNQPSQSPASLNTEKGTSPEPPITGELNQQIDLLIQCLHDEKSNGNDISSTQPMDILKGMMTLYTKWCSTDRPSPQFKFKASATIDKAFRLVTNEAFSPPYQLSWVNLGVETLQLQLHSSRFRDDSENGNPTIKGKRSIRLKPLQGPYTAITKGTWLKALQALTSKDINSSQSSQYNTRSIKTISPKDESQWIAPPTAAFRILQRLVDGRGIRTWHKKGSQQKQQQQSLDERDFNMVLHAYAAYPQKVFMHAAHRVMALQERTAHAPPLSPVAYSILLKAYGRWKDVKNVEMSILHAQRNGVVPDIVMANTVLDAYVNCGMLDKAQEAFRSMTNSGKAESTGEVEGFWPLLRPNTRTYNTLLKGMAEEGDIRGAMKFSKLVQTKGLWDDITTNTLVKAAVTANEFYMAETILSNHTASERSQRRSDHPNIEAYTELLDGYAKDGQLENAIRVMQLMENRGVTPNEYTYTCMVGALASNNKVRQARKMLNYAADLPPKDGRRMVLTPTYNAFISGLLSDRKNYNVEITGQSSHAAKVVEVLSVLKEMQDSKIRPNVVTTALVVDGLGRCSPPRCKEATELVQHLEFNSRPRQNGYLQGVGENAKGISLSNNKIATALIRAYGRANELGSAMHSFKCIAAPDVVAFNALLDACCQCEELKLAFDLFKTHASFEQWNKQEETANASMNVGGEKELTSIKPDVVTYTTLISALLQLKSRAATKRANALYSEMKKKWWISPDTILVDTILTAMISGGPIGFEEDDMQFTLTALRDGARLEWEKGQYEKRKRAVRGIIVGCSREIWKHDEFASGLMREKTEDPLFAKKGWNKIDSGFRLWGGGGDATQQTDGDNSSVDSFLASKGWNDIDSGFRLL